MNRAGRTRRGQPLVSIGLVLLGWVGLRTALWENPFPAQLTGEVSQLLAATPEGGATEQRAMPPTKEVPRDPVSPQQVTGPHQPQARIPGLLAEGLEPVSLAQQKSLLAGGQQGVAHNLLWMAASAYMPLLANVDRLLGQPPAAVPQPAGRLEYAAAQSGRWQADGWLLMRGGDRLAPGAGERPASYGSSQAGAVLAFRLAPSSPHRPVVYARASQALVRNGESELALGLRARPLAQLPLDLHAEMRATRRSGGTELRPSAFATIGMERSDLPFGLETRAYAQAGWVGGKYATPFVDGQIVAERELADFDLARVSVGAGSWGGAQRGAERLDIGPTTSLRIKIGDTSARLSADYRIRVAGDAVPGSGVAVTLISGF